MIEDEEWRAVSGQPDYLVSTNGRVMRGDSGAVLKTRLLNGYPSVTIRGKSLTVHRLVAIAFVPGRTKRRCLVNHIDGDKTYANVDNLEWVSPVENINHAIENGLRRPNTNRQYYPRKK